MDVYDTWDRFEALIIMMKKYEWALTVSQDLQLVYPFEDGFTVRSNEYAPGLQVSSFITIVHSHEELMGEIGIRMGSKGIYGFFGIC
ncbi:hypothetical protein [Bacillus mojavensis]|uniref:hypothetical protein n=1 Tax=Bacillus mojavensis TaxID=72360 RepID=UPI002DBA4629|nr:hypothetical protein [Bacillus mojavensis]MEC1775042.1 hypothetical protein [Bacillus mojavensis]